MERLRISSLQWAFGLFWIIIGALLLVVPHRVELPAIPNLPLSSAQAGLFFTLLGLLLTGSSLLPHPNWLSRAAFAISAVCMFTLAWQYQRSGNLLEPIQLALASIALTVAVFSPRNTRVHLSPPQGDLLAITASIAALITGLVLFIRPAGVGMPFLPENTRFALAIAFSVAGLWLFGVQVFHLNRRLSLLERSWPEMWGSYMLAGIVLLAFLVISLAPQNMWVIASLFAVTGLFLILMPWALFLRPWLAPNGLTPRLSYVAVLLVCGPLLAAAALTGLRMEERQRAETPFHLQGDALLLAQSLEGKLRTHQAVLAAVGQAGLPTLAVEEQIDRLQAIENTDPDLGLIAFFDARGNPLSSSAGSVLPVTGTLLNNPSRVRTLLFHPVSLANDGNDRVVLLSQQINDSNGSLAGILTAELPVNQLGNQLRGAHLLPGSQVILRMDEELFVLRPDGRFAILDDAGLGEAVSQRSTSSGSLTYSADNEDILASYASLPETGWQVIVSQPASSAFAQVATTREQALLLLAGSFLLAMLAGAIIARTVGAPLVSLTTAIEDLLEGVDSTPLRNPNFREAIRLNQAFSRLRSQLTTRLASREKALDALRSARKQYEQQLAIQGVELVKMKEQLLKMFDQLNAEQSTRAHYERAYQESLHRFDILGEVIPCGTWQADAKGRLTSASQSYLDLIGMTLEEARLFGWTRRVMAEDVISVMHHWTEAIRTGTNVDVEYCLRGSDQCVHTIRALGKPVRNESGAICGWAGIHLNVSTERHWQQTALEAQTRLRLLLDHVPAWVAASDCDLRYTWAADGRAGMHPDQLLGKTDAEAFPGSDVAELTAMKNTALQGLKSVHKEVRLEINGKPARFDVAVEPVFGKSGQPAGLVLAAIDISERKQMEEDLERNIIQIELQHRVNDQHEIERIKFARDLHDGPLQDLIAATFQLQQVILQVGEETSREKLNSVQANLQQQVRNLRNLSFAMRPPILSRFGLAKAIQSYLENFCARNPELRVNSELMEDGQLLPERVRAALFRICQEALTNAARHSKASVIDVRLYFQGDQAILQIDDNGEGFVLPADLLSLARSGHLGLAGIHERVQSLDGVLTIQSAPGEGTHLRVIVPFILERGSLPS